MTIFKFYFDLTEPLGNEMILGSFKETKKKLLYFIIFIEINLNSKKYYNTITTNEI